MNEDSVKISSMGPKTSKSFNTKLDQICTEERSVNPAILRRVIEIGIAIAREGREGRKIGTMFVVGDAQTVLSFSRELILDPLRGHALEKKHISDPNVQETVKELAQLDGAFIVSDEGYVLSGARYIETRSKDIELPLGLGSRHLAGASISQETKAVAVVVSETSVVRIFDKGKIIAEIIPELWLLQRTESDSIKASKKSFKDYVKKFLRMN
jgi:DNA integrity scanning protein DisA with diadenylate cyclase activity